MAISEPLRNLRYLTVGTRWRSGNPLRAVRSWVRFLKGSLGYFIDIILPAALVAIGSTQPLTEIRSIGFCTCRWSRNSGEHQLPGAVRACTGTVLPLCQSFTFLGAADAGFCALKLRA
jgi:hypothetical protein